MLSPAQFESIGRITIAFNHIEYLIDVYAGLLIGSEDEITKRLMAREQFFARKKALLVDLLQAVRKSHPTLQEKIDKVQAVLVEVDRVTRRRNEIIHSLLIVDNRKDRSPILWNKHKDTITDCSLESLEAIRVEIDAVGAEFNLACFEFTGDLLSERQT